MHSIFEWKLAKRKNGSKFLKLIYYSNEAGGYVEAGRFNISNAELVNNDWSIEGVLREIDIVTDVDLRIKHQKTVDSLKAKIFDIQCVIEKMSDYISKQDIDEDICKQQLYKLEFGECYDNNGKKMDCQQCIINYFKQEVGMK